MNSTQAKSLSLGGRYTDIIHSYIYIIFCRLFVYPCFVPFVYFFLDCFISVVSLLFSFGGCHYCSILYFYFFVCVPRIAFNRKEVISWELLPEDRFCAGTEKIRKNSQNVILSCKFTSTFPRLLSNFHQLNTFRSEQLQIF